MAKNTNNEELKQQLLRTLADGRGEISEAVHVVRRALSPRLMLQRVVDRHAGLLVAVAVTAGIIPVLLILRGRRTTHRGHFPLMFSVAKPPPKPLLGALLLGVLGLLGKSVTPALIKSVVMPHVLNLFAKKQPHTNLGSPPV